MRDPFWAIVEGEVNEEGAAVRHAALPGEDGHVTAKAGVMSADDEAGWDTIVDRLQLLTELFESFPPLVHVEMSFDAVRTGRCVESTIRLPASGDVAFCFEVDAASDMVYVTARRAVDGLVASTDFCTVVSLGDWLGTTGPR